MIQYLTILFNDLFKFEFKDERCEKFDLLITFTLYLFTFLNVYEFADVCKELNLICIFACKLVN